jgi:hypothetical protein
MSDAQFRTSELDKWSVVTRLCADFDQAAALAQEFMHRTSHIVLWPIKQNQWLVIARLPVMLN